MWKLWSTLGAGKIMEVVEYSNANQWKDLSFSLFRRTSAWAYSALAFNEVVLRVGFGQYFMQRSVACKSIKDARKSIFLGVTLTLLVGSVLIGLIGMGTLAYFDGCDPVKSKQIKRYDQIIPYLATKVFDGTPGMVGLYISAGYSATLSTVSTGLNSFATVFFKVKKSIQSLINYMLIKI